MTSDTYILVLDNLHYLCYFWKTYGMFRALSGLLRLLTEGWGRYICFTDIIWHFVVYKK